MLYVVIPVLNNRPFLQNLLASLSQVPDSIGIRVLIVDNGNDNSGVEMATRCPGPISAIMNERNIGVAASWNHGIRVALDNNSEAVLVAGQDTCPMPGTIERLFGLIKAGVLFATGSQVPYRDAVIPVDPAPSITTPLLAAPDFSFFMMSPLVVQAVGNHDANLDFQVRQQVLANASDNGEALALPAVLMKPWEWGLFDSRFFPSYYEDNDYHYRMHRAGVLAVRDPGAIFRHECSLTMRSNDEIREMVQGGAFQRNAALFKEKWGIEAHESGLQRARPGNVSDEQWARMSGGRPVEELPAEQVLAQAREIYGRYGVSVGA